MRIIIKPTPDECAQWVADHVEKAINAFGPTADKPFILGCPTGSTPVRTYKKLIEKCKAGTLSFEHVVTFNMDEYIGLKPDHPQSYRFFMYEHLFSHVNIKPENTNFLNGMTDDYTKECTRYEALIKKYGGIHLFMAGIGADGHLAFNEPGSSLSSRTRVKTLTHDTRVANARFFDGNIEEVPKIALTVGVQTVLDAQEVVMMGYGAGKSVAIAKCVEEGVNHMWTASALQLHPKSVIACDDEATLELKVKTVKYFKDIEADGE